MRGAFPREKKRLGSPVHQLITNEDEKSLQAVEKLKKTS